MKEICVAVKHCSSAASAVHMTIQESNKLTCIQEKFNVRPIRKENVAEKQAIVALVNRCYRSSENWTNESKIVSGLRITMESLQEALQQSEILVVEDRCTGALVACIKTGVTNETVVGPLPECTGYMGMFAVSPEYQSQGIGSYLMNAAERFCEEKGMTKMTMDVLSVRHDIIKWYERRGYKQTDDSIDAAPFMMQKGEKLLTACSFILMRKDLQ